MMKLTSFEKIKLLLKITLNSSFVILFISVIIDFNKEHNLSFISILYNIIFFICTLLIIAQGFEPLKDLYDNEVFIFKGIITGKESEGFRTGRNINVLMFEEGKHEVSFFQYYKVKVGDEVEIRICKNSNNVITLKKVG